MKNAIKVVMVLIAINLTMPAITKAESMNWRVYAYGTKSEVIPIGFAKAPENIIFEKRGLAEFSNGEIASLIMRGSGKITPGGGGVEGYVQYTFEDGATNVVKWQAELTKNDDQELMTFDGKGAYVSGTGRFTGIKGDVRFKGRYITPLSKEQGTMGDMIVDVESNYTLSAQ